MLGLNLLCLKRRRKAWSPPSARQTPPAPRTKGPRPGKRISAPRESPGRPMAPTPPLPVTEDTPPDMLAGSMDLHVVLPTGRSVKMSVERGTPMMDLLVQVATANKIPPGGHVIQAVGERGLLPYKPSTPIGALDTWTIQIVPKSRPSSTAGSKTASSKASNQQPFEQTFRLQVHLPRNQLFVARVSPKTVLSDVLTLACTEKNLDPSKYELRHPANLEERLRPDWTLADYKLQEVTMVAKRGRPLGAGLSSSDIMALQKEEEKRRQQTRAGGSTGSAVLGLMFNKRSQSSVCDGSVSSDSLGGRSISPINSDDTPSPPGSSLPPPRPARKRRPAPKPPGPPAAVISHSRNSSDSSGYHEASVLSESPESNGLSSPSGTLPRRSKLTSVTPAPPQNTSLSRSLSNLTTVSNGGNKPAPRPEGMKNCTHSVSTSSLASSGHGKKKKAAPPPPPGAANFSKMTAREPVQPQRTLSLSTLSSQSSIDNCDGASDGMLERNRLSSSVSVSRQGIQPVPEEVPKIPPTEDKHSCEMSRESSVEMYSETSSNLSSPERQTSPLDIKTTSTAIQEKNAKNKVKQQSPELENVMLKKTEINNETNVKSFPVSPIVEIKNKNNKLKCEQRLPEPQPKLLVEKPPASSKVEPLPDVVSGLQLDSEEIDRAFQSVTDELEAAILADELKQASPLPDPPSPVTGSRSPSLSDWEYQLPAPPTAFQDRQSPTPTLGETIELGETGVFKENLPSEPLPPRFSNPKSQASEQISRESMPQSTLSSGQCLPSQDIDERLIKSKTTINPLYNAELFDREAIQNEELNERLSGNTAEHKTSLHNGVGKNDEEEDDWEPQQLRAVSEVDKELKNSSNNVIRRSSFNNDVVQSNQLKNFTITTYQRPRDTDNIFSEENGLRRNMLSEFKKPLEATLSKQQNGSAHPLASTTSLPRTNSFSTGNMEPVEHSVVRRSTSHVSLVNSARNLRAKSIGNISAVIPREGRKNSESDAIVDNGHERLRKTSSEVAINRGSDDINRVEQSAGHPVSSDKPLQSLQVMRNILNPNDQDPGQDTNSDEQVLRRVSSEMHSAQKREDTEVSQPVVKPAVTTEVQSESTTNSDVTRRYRYSPPSVNFSTWSERPKSQVSIKLDSDYRIGTGQGGCQESQSATEVKTEQRERLSDTTSGGEPKNTSGVKLSQGEVSTNPAINQTTKVEPVPLSMRIVSHTTSSSYTKRTPSFSNQRIDFVSKTNDQNSKETHQVVVRTSSYNTAQIADPSRIPIVRAVELKKSFLQGHQQQQSQQQNNSTSVQVTWNGTDDLTKRNGTNDVKNNSENEQPEIFQGVNNLAKRFSGAAPNTECIRVGFRGNSTRPVSAYLYNGSNDTTEPSDLKRNSTSTSALNTVGIGEAYAGNTSSHLNANGPKKYTSVVGINGAAILTSSFREPDVNRNHPKVTNSASIKVNGFAVPKQPMPVVKGFRYPSHGTNHSDSSLLAANSHKSSVSEPLTVKVQRSDSYSNQNQRNSSVEPAPTFNVRIQHTPTVKIDSSQTKTRQTTIPVPPPAPAPLKKTVSVRPKSFAASEPSPRDQLMDAIRNFGGRNNLKQTGGS